MKAILGALVFSAILGSGQGIISTYANPGTTGANGIAFDAQGNLYYSWTAQAKIIKVSPSGTSTTIAGNGSFGFAGDGGPAINATLMTPAGVAVDSAGNVYFSDSGNHVIRKIDTSGIITTFAGTPQTPGSPVENVQATSSPLNQPGDLEFDSAGNLYVADNDNNRVRKITPAGIITTVAGNGNVAFSGDNVQATATATRGSLNIAIDAQGNLYISENDARVRKVATNGIITTFAGTGTRGFSGDGGPATAAMIKSPIGIGVDRFGNVYFADNSNGRVRKVDASGIITTYAGIDGNASTPLGDGGPATSAYLGNVGALAVDANGAVYVNASNIIRKIEPAGGSTIAPKINTGQIYNASGYQAKLAPDTVFVIFGSNMGPASIQVANAPDYPQNLAGTSVTFTPTTGTGPAIEAKMVYTLAGQIAGLLPSSIAPGTYAVRVTYNGSTSAPQNVTVVARSFGIAAANSGGSGIAQATIGNGTSLTRFTSGTVDFNGYTWTLTPAHPGDTIVLWGTGGGADAQNDTGGTLGNQTIAGNFKVNVGARQVAPDYAGASQGYPGLWQINFVIPSDMTPDCFATVQVSAGGELSNAVVIPIAAVGQTTCVDPAVPASVMSKIDAGGSITSATFTIAKVTQSATTTEIASGSVWSYTAAQWTMQNSGPQFGYCRVYDRTIPVGGVDPASPTLSLDAGSKLALSGPGLPAGFGLNSIASTSGPQYSNSVTPGTLTGGTYTLSGTGGAGVEAFSASTLFPSNFTVTNWDSITSINRSQPLTFNWTGSNFDQVAVVLSTSVTANLTQHLTTINCTIPGSLGTYTIPAAALAYLSPVAGTSTSFSSLSVQGISAPGKFTANLTNGGTTDFGVFGANLGYSKGLTVQ